MTLYESFMVLHVAQKFVTVGVGVSVRVGVIVGVGVLVSVGVGVGVEDKELQETLVEYNPIIVSVAAKQFPGPKPQSE